MIRSLNSIDWSSFLARPRLPAPPAEALNLLRDQPILITGTGGSIGSALAMRLSALGTRKLILLEASESSLYALERDWNTAGVAQMPEFYLGSAGDVNLLDEIFSLHAPRIVFHAAAFKHVPLMEEQPLAAIANNIFATESITRISAANSAYVVLLSTDKAVAPASVMGATKRVAEQIVLTSGGTALRLGNVLASRDSVAEIFVRQIAEGGPLTVTDPAARRYFLTIDEAVDLLLTAAAESTQCTLLAPVLPATHVIVELARFMVRQLSPQQEVAIEFTGLRAGDKETEAMWSAEERTSRSRIDGMLAIESALPAKTQLTDRLASLRAALDARDLGEALAHLRALVPDYTPSRKVIALAAKSGARVCL